MHHNDLPSLDYLDAVFDADFETGKLFWRKNRGQRALRGAEAGSNDGGGYRGVKIDGVKYKVHRIIYALAHRIDPSDLEIDHINGVKDDNRLVNLRLATRSLNCVNHRSWRAGLRGAYPKNGRWMAVIQVDNNREYLGHFDTEEAAHAAFSVEALKYRGNTARLD